MRVEDRGRWPGRTGLRRQQILAQYKFNMDSNGASLAAPGLFGLVQNVLASSEVFLVLVASY